MTDDAIVLPYTGEIVPYDDPQACVMALATVRDLEQRLRDAKADLTAALSAEFRRQGTKTMEYSGVKASLVGGTETVWDIEVLEKLRDLGLPEERFNELVTAEVSYKVNGQVAKQIAAANHEYAAVIESAKTVIPKSQYVRLG